MDRRASSGIEPYLLPGEVLIWSGVPQQGILFQARDALLVPFGLFFLGFSLVWEAGVSRSNGFTLFSLFGVPFVLMGLFASFGRFPLDDWLRRRISYALTDRRILILRRGPWPSFTALALEHLP